MTQAIRTLREVDAPAARANDTRAEESRAEETARMSGGNQDPIGQHLRRAYEGFASEPIPDKLQQLLDTLRQKESEKDKE
ncbi:MAG: NepR family anti-sigma factor [Paracoccaceae bacterium]